MQKNVSFVVIIVLILCLFGCFRVTVNEYDRPMIEYEWGKVSGKLSGREMSSGCSVRFQSPYRLSLWFDAKDHERGKGSIKIDSIRFFDLDRNEEVFFLSDIEESKFSLNKLREVYSAYFFFPEIGLPYKDLVCLIDFSYRDSGTSTKHQAKLQFQKDPKKYWTTISV